MKFSQKIFAGLLLVAFALAFTTQSCKKDEDKDAPTIPPIETFKLNLNDLGVADTTQKSTNGVMTYQNWGHSAGNVFIWNAIVTFGMAVPVASFVESFNHEAEYHSGDDEYWTWTYNFNAGGSHQAELTGYMENDSVVWEMRIDDFLWYHGKSHYQGTGGYWILNESKVNTNQLLRIEWNKNSDGTADIKYTNVKPNGPENGGYIHYGITTTGDYDRYYYIYNKGQLNLTEIEWNKVNRNGRVADPKKFEDNGEWHYWDTTLNDVTE